MYFKKISTAEPVLDCLEKLYSLGVLDNKGQQELKLKDENWINACSARWNGKPRYIKLPWRKDCWHPQCGPGCVESARLQVLIRSPGHTFSDALEPGNSTAVVGITQPAGSWVLTQWIEEVTDALRNVILQHSYIRTFVRHYEVDVDVDVQSIIRKTSSQTP